MFVFVFARVYLVVYTYLLYLDVLFPIVSRFRFGRGLSLFILILILMRRFRIMWF